MYVCNSRYQWVKERDLVKDARVTVEVLQQILSFLHKEKLVKCEQKGEVCFASIKHTLIDLGYTSLLVHLPGDFVQVSKHI